MSWDTEIAPSQFDSVVAVLASAGVELLYPAESSGSLECGYSTYTMRRAEFLHATTGERLVLEDYLSEYMSWDSGDRYTFTALVRPVGHLLPETEIRNLSFEEQVRLEIDEMEKNVF